MPADILWTNRMILRPFSLQDVDELLILWTEPGVRRYLWDDKIITREQVVDIVNASMSGFGQGKLGLWSLSPREVYRLIGFAGFRQLSDGETELLYGLTQLLWGQGLATEAAQEVIRYAFRTTNLARIYAGSDPPNSASFKVMKNLGMQFSDRRVVNGVEADYYVLERPQPAG